MLQSYNSFLSGFMGTCRAGFLFLQFLKTYKVRILDLNLVDNGGKSEIGFLEFNPGWHANNPGWHANIQNIIVSNCGKRVV